MTVDKSRSKRPLPKGERTKERLRQGVRNLLANRDLDSVSIDDIVKETGIPVGSIYFHFGNKDDLLISIFEKSISEFFEYFSDVSDRELYETIYLFCWRSVQLRVLRRGMIQLHRWVLHKDIPKFKNSWIRQRNKLVADIANVIVKHTEEADLHAHYVRLVKIHFIGIRDFLREFDFQEENPVLVAKDMADSFYRAVTAEVPDEARTSLVRDQIHGETTLLQRPIPLPPADDD